MAIQDEVLRKKIAAREMRERCAAFGGRIAENAQVNIALTFNGPIDIADGAVIYAPVEIGDFSYLNVGTIVFPHVKIGRFCSIGRSVQIGLARHPTKFLSSHPFQFSNGLFSKVPGYSALQKEKWQFHKPTAVGHDVWIGAGALISSGVNIGHGAVVGAGAVVTKDVQPYAIVGGVPARVIGLRFDEETVNRLLKTEWWGLSLDALAKVEFSDVQLALAQLESMKP